MNFRIALIIIVFASTTVFAFAKGGDWDRYVDQSFGYSALYPVDVFTGSEASPNGRTFLSDDGRAKFRVFAIYNSENMSLDEYRGTLLREFPGYERLVYGPRGSNWFVLSGEHGDSIYYHKVMFSCGARVINVFALNYPIAQRDVFDPIVTVIEKNFQSASGPACANARR